MRTTQCLMLIALLVVILAAITYSQPYEPEHLWYRCGDEPNDWFGYNAAGIGDVNEDTYEDFVVSTKTGTNPHEAYVMLFYGGNPPDTIPDITFSNPYPYGYFGIEIENVGDVNGDQWDDIAILGGYNQDDIHRVFVYYGGVDLDTIPDLEISELNYSAAFGYTIEGINDVNSDGYDDIAIHATDYNNTSGKVWVYLGGSPMDTIADWSQEGCGNNANYGRSIAGGGDLNGDGYDDFAIYEWTGYPNDAETTYYIFFGDSQLDTIPDIIIDGQLYYPSIDISGPSALIPNLNGDDYSDLVIVAGNTTNAVVFHGGDPMDTDIDVVLGGFDPNPPGFAMNVSFAGDVNRDGYGDVIVSQIQAFGYGGLINLYLGSPWMTVMYSMQWWGIGNPWDGCGRTLLDCGDINGDGVDDIMFGSLYGTNRGRIDIWKGDTAFVADVPSDIPHPIPHSFLLLPPYPNPFNSNLNIPFEAAPGLVGKINLKIYNLLGQEVVDLTTEIRNKLSGQISGRFEVLWDGRDMVGEVVGSGVYIVEMVWGSNHQVQKALLLR